jgi:hypothetical protein
LLVAEKCETPAGIASQARPRSEERARRLAVRPRKASIFTLVLYLKKQQSIGKQPSHFFTIKRDLDNSNCYTQSIKDNIYITSMILSDS